MQLSRVRLQNFRCFKDLTLDLHPEFTLLVGSNGAGKTSVLEGLAVALGGWLLGFPTVEQRHIRRHEMRLVQVVRNNVPSLEATGTTAVHAEGGVAGTEVSWTRELRTPSGRTTHGGAKELRALAEAANAKVPTEKPTDLPVIAYYGTSRLWVQKREREGRLNELGSILQGYVACLEPASDHKLFEAWMAWREQVRIQELVGTALQGKIRASISAPLLDAVANAACSCVEGAQRFYYSLNYRELILEMDDGRIIPFNLLSDGYRNLLAVAADIAWRAARLNPHYGAEAATRATGVVLIDEIDLHLHPHWQRRVIADLRRAFPRLQFIATTHSPQVVSTAKPGWIRILTDDQRVGPALHTYGRDTNSLLREVFGVPERPEHALRLIESIEAALAEGRLDDVRIELAALELHLGTDDDIVRGLRWELHDAGSADVSGS